MKYKACCNRVCLLYNCESREQGACYCICRLIDGINTMKMVIEGTMVACGCIYCPDDKDRLDWHSRLSPERREIEDRFRLVDAPRYLAEMEEKLKGAIL